MDVKLESITNVKSTTYATYGLPSMALDSGSPPAIPDRGRLCRNDGFRAKMRIAGLALTDSTRPVICFKMAFVTIPEPSIKPFC